MFADDTTAFCIGNTIDEVLLHIQEVITDLNNWAKSNFMTIHLAKTEIDAVVQIISDSIYFKGIVPSVTYLRILEVTLAPCN